MRENNMQGSSPASMVERFFGTTGVINPKRNVKSYGALLYYAAFLDTKRN